MRLAFFLGTVVMVLLGCGGRSSSSAPTGSSGTGPTGGAGAGREPMRHRASSGPSCPAERGSSEPSLDQCTNTQLIGCYHDSDCTSGEHGRCLAQHFGCSSGCSYDECSTDADCPDGEPCECRSGPGDFTTNRCIRTGNCGVDADCGPGGYCSPSLVGQLCSCMSVDYCTTIGSPCTPAGTCACGNSCGNAYYCHTPSDTCLDDDDCTSGATCNWDLAHLDWSCSECWPLP